VRILQVTPYFAPAWAYGGPPRVMYQFARGLAARGRRVTVYTTDVLDAETRAGPAREWMDGVEVRRFANVSNTLAWRTKKYIPPGLLARLARDVRDYDVVHITDTRTALVAAAYLATRAFGVPLCVSAHGSLPGSHGLRGRIKDGYDAVFVRPMLGRAALLLAQTTHEAQLYRQFGGRDEAVRMLPLPLERSPKMIRPEPGAFRTLTGIPEGEPVALFLGRIHRLKGLDFLIESIEPLLADGAMTLVVAGRDDGQWTEIADRWRSMLASGRIRLAGPMYGDERFAAYADADVFCLTPPHWEETSLASLEAAAAGTPVVVTEQAEIPGLTEADAGLVVAHDRHAVRSAVEHTVARSVEMGVAARALMERQHDPEAVVARLERYLDEAAGRGGRA